MIQNKKKFNNYKHNQNKKKNNLLKLLKNRKIKIINEEHNIH